MDTCVDWEKLKEFSSEIASKWVVVGINLLPNEHHDMIRELIDHGEKTDEEKCTLFLKRWIELSSTDDRSWGKLCSVLRSHKVKMDGLAAKIEDVSCVAYRFQREDYPRPIAGDTPEVSMYVAQLIYYMELVRQNEVNPMTG